MPLEPRASAPPEFRMPNIGERGERPYQRRELIERDPDCGRIVCFCERVTRGEIRDALEAPVPAVDLDGLRRRTRAHMGRCQGFFCGAELADRLDGAGQAADSTRFAGGRGAGR
jgi:glycerol-3-phosphate dehydrogenase